MNKNLFTIREDRHGLSLVFLLGNALGCCPYNCRFCSTKTSRKVHPDEAIHRFDELCLQYSPEIDGPYHALIFNHGNVTNELECPTHVLDHILDQFSNDGRVVYVSLNSREREASREVLEGLAQKKLPFPVHFIFGLESFSPRMPEILGKDTRGELERFIRKLEPFNAGHDFGEGGNTYTFGLDVNLIFLPELYRTEGQVGSVGPAEAKRGLMGDLRKLLSESSASVPMQINIHPYCRVDALSYGDENLNVLMAVLPELQDMISSHNITVISPPVHIFVGVEGLGYAKAEQFHQIREWKPVIDEFNRSGLVDLQLRGT